MRPGLPRRSTRRPVVLVEPVALDAEDFPVIDRDPAAPGLRLGVPDAQQELHRDHAGIEPARWGLRICSWCREAHDNEDNERGQADRCRAGNEHDAAFHLQRVRSVRVRRDHLALVRDPRPQSAWRLTLFLRNRTEPSPIKMLAPPGW